MMLVELPFTPGTESAMEAMTTVGLLSCSFELGDAISMPDLPLLSLLKLAFDM